MGFFIHLYGSEGKNSREKVSSMSAKTFISAWFPGSVCFCTGAAGEKVPTGRSGERGIQNTDINWVTSILGRFNRFSSSVSSSFFRSGIPFEIGKIESVIQSPEQKMRKKDIKRR